MAACEFAGSGGGGRALEIEATDVEEAESRKLIVSFLVFATKVAPGAGCKVI